MPSQITAIESIAKVLIIDSSNRGLVLLFGEHLNLPEKSFSPDLPGGIVDANESEQQTAVREVREECGFELDPTSLQLVYTKTAYYEKERKTVSKLLYVARVKEVPTITLSWEHSEYRWVPVDELDQVAFSQFLSEAIRYNLDYHII